MNNRSTVKYILAASTLFTPFVAAPAFAADQIDEIVVTAQKREEKLQEVPVAITAIGKDQLEIRNISTTQDLSAVAPNLTTGPSTSGAGDTTISLRGLPAADALLSQDGPVGMYIDGVINARIAGSVLDLVDLERVEVLRGPQGTLYGRNTTGGAVNFITRKPDTEFGITQKLSYINPNGGAGFASRTAIDTGELGETGLSATANFLYKKIDGYFDNIAQSSDKDPGAENVRAGRIAINYDRGDQFRANYQLYRLEQENGTSVGQITALSPATLFLQRGTPIPVTQDRRDTFNLPNQSTDDVELWMHNLTMEVDVSDNLTIRSITGYRDYKGFHNGPQFGEPFTANAFVGVGPAPTFTPIFANVTGCLFCATNSRTHTQLSQEIQLIGQSGDQVFGGDRFVYNVGAYYFKEEGTERNPQTFFFPGFAVFTGNSFAYETDTESWAIFGQTSYTPKFDDRLRFTGGLRYSTDEKSTTLFTSVTNLTPRAQATKKFNALTYLAKAQYFLSDNANTYVSYSRGFKAGGFNTRAALEPFGPEKLNALEAGFKATWFNRRLQTNVAVFKNVAEDQQISQFVAGAGGAVSVTTNAGKSEYHGIEFEVLAKLFAGFSVDMNLGFINPTFKEYLTGDPGLPSAPNNPPIPFDAKDVARFGYQSEQTGAFGLQYGSDPIAWLRDGTLSARVEALWQSGQEFHPAIVYPSGARDNPLIDYTSGDARTLINGRVALRDIALGGKLKGELAIWGRNILDEEYVVQGIDFGALGLAEQTFGPPQTFGIDLTLKY